MENLNLTPGGVAWLCRYRKYPLHITCSILFTLLILTSSGQGRTVFQLEAGTRAPWGSNQHLFIDNRGNAQYFVTEVDKEGQTDSQKFSLRQTQVDSLLLAAGNFDFFKLDSAYVQDLDGDGIFMAIRYAGKFKTVEVANREIPEIRKIVNWLNQMLAIRHIKIEY
jgi:hypothetical protein